METLPEVDPDLFALSPEPSIRMEMVGGRIPVLMVDNVYAHPEDVRRFALTLDFEPPPYAYPGRLAVPPLNPSLVAMTQWARNLVNRTYLPEVPPISRDGRRVSELRGVYTDFAILDVPPDELSHEQRIPHTDAVPIFGLVYLNSEERGGTLFFQQTGPVSPEMIGTGYLTQDNNCFRVVGRITSAFNRLAVYPGFIPHSADISGDWISGEERKTAPRLTQRVVLQP